MIPEGNDTNRVQRCACVCGTSMGVLSAGRIAIMVIGLLDGGGGPVGCSDWLSVHGLVVVCPGGVRIIYIRKGRTGSSSLDAAPVTGSSLLLCIALQDIALLDFICGYYFVVLIVSGLLVVN